MVAWWSVVRRLVRRGGLVRYVRTHREQVFASLAGIVGVLFIGVYWQDVARFLGIEHASASAYAVQTGYYIGTGASQEISGLGFTPDLVILKADDASGVGALMKTSVMPVNNTAILSGAASADDAAGAILLTADGFRVTGANSNTVNARYTWIAFAGSDCSSGGQFCVGTYLGNAGANQSITSVGFQPNLVIAKAATAVAPAWRSSSMGNNVGQYFSATAQDATGVLFQTLNATGFTVGATINTAATYYYAAFKEASGVIDVGSYTGNATDGTNISGVGFVPDFVFVKNANVAVGTVYNVNESYGDSTSYFPDTAVLVDSIQALQSDGFQVGANNTANGSGNTIYYAAFGGANDTRSATGTFTMVSGSYTGTGAARTISGLGFSPDLVIVKASTTQAGVFRTRMMAGDSTAYLDSATTNFAGGITALQNDGFTVGTAAQVNTSGTTYVWVAYGNAWKPETNSGATDFTIGAYYVPATAIDNRNVTRLPMSPDFVAAKRFGATAGVWRTTEHSGDLSSFYGATAEAANNVQALNADGFQIGTAANVATVSSLYWYFAFATGTNFMVGTYGGTGSARTQSAAFQPDFLFVKNVGATRGVLETTELSQMGSTSAPFLNVAPITNAVTGLVSGGFTVGTGAEANSNGVNYRYAGWKSTGTVSSTPEPYAVQTGYYIGTGASQEISGLGFTPDLVILKADDASGVGALMKTSVMPVNNTAILSGAASADDAAGAILLTADGFRVTGANSNTVNARYTWIAFAGSDCSSGGQFCVGTYLGNAGANQSITSVGFQPNLVIAKAATAVAPAWRSSSMGNNVGQYFSATAQDATGVLFQTLNATGFTVGATINTAATYYYAAFKEASGVIDVGSYTGNATDGTNISGVGFVPDFVFVKNANVAVGTVYNVNESYGDSTSYFPDTAVLVDSIQALQSDGFQVGANNTANGSGNTIYYAAFGGANDTRSATGTFTMVSGSYTGTGAARTISGLGFSPDLVIVKASTTQAGVFRTRMMAGDSTAYLDSATTNFAGGITALQNDGFTVGTAAQVNTSGTTYVWVAYGNAWKPETNSGATDFTIGAYYVPATAIDNRNVTRLPMSPDFVAAKRFGATAGVWRTTEHSGDLSSFYGATAEAANNVQALNADGFQIGTAANVATVSSLYWYFAFATGTNFMVGTYGGTGSARTQSAAFQPDFLFVKNVGATRGVLETTELSQMGSTSAPFLNVAPITNAVTGLVSGGFTVGTGAEANSNGVNYRYAGWQVTDLVQAHYHFRRDDDTEALATSLTGGVEDTPYSAAQEGPTIRLRFAVGNGSATTTPPTTFRLEYATKTYSCATATGWIAVADADGAWDPSPSANLTEGGDTTNIAVSSGGVTDPDTTFLTPNGGVRDTTGEAGPLSLAPTNFVELEYAIEAVSGAVDGTTYCFRVSNAGAPLPTYTKYAEATFNNHLFLTATGTQRETIDIPTASSSVGGMFVVSDLTDGDTHTVTEVTITETGTVDAQVDLDNVKLFYDLDTTDPYDCVGETFSGTEAQYGVTDTDGFSGPNGSSTFAGSVVASGTQAICFHPVVDVLSSATSGETLELQVTTARDDVLASGGDITRGTDPTLLASTTTLIDDRLTQAHYHWRYDDGNESGATSVTAGSEDVEYLNMPRNVTRRLRLEVSNEGATTSSSTQYRLEYGAKAGTCAAVASWTDVGAVGGSFDMSDSTYVVDGSDTTNISLASGGVTDENTTLRTPNGAFKDTSSQTAGLPLSTTEFVELEYAVKGTVLALDGTTYCFRVTDTGTELPAYDVYAEATMQAAVLVSASGTQAVSAVSPGSDQYLGGAFVIQDQVASRTVTHITVTETGTVDAQADLSNIRLFYEYSTTTPYDCSDVAYDGNESQFGAASSSFSAANGSSTFVGAAPIASTSALCVYVVLDVDGTAGSLETIDVEITNPGLEVVVSSGAVNPNTPVAISGATTIEKALVSQTHYHFRNDDGSEAGATSATGGVEDTPVTGRLRNEAVRLRVEASKGGTNPSLPTVFGLEYGLKVSTCDAIGSWTPIETQDGAWVLSDSPYLTNGDDTTDVAGGIGGVTNSNSTFLTPNGGVRDTTATTSPLTLLSTNYLELEYSLEPTENASFGSTYCFRLTQNGATLDTYDVYPQATLQVQQDFYIQRGVSTITAGNLTTTITAGAEYTAPATNTRAFIRITNAAETGAGANSGGGAQNANQVTVSIQNPSNLVSDVSFRRSNSTNNTRVYWEIIEYIGPSGGDNEMKVRAADAVAYTSSSLYATTSAASGVTSDSDVVVFITGQENAAANTTNYSAGRGTAVWNAADDTATFTRGTTGSVIATTSYALVEFTGVNWKVQRSEHTHSSAGSTETENITAVNDLSRAFLHAQKRVGANQVDEFGHEVWLSSVGQVSYLIPSTAASANTHVHVAWIIENTQTNGNPMIVTRTNATQVSGGAEPSVYSIPITATLSSVSNASIFMNMIGNGNTNAHPRAIMGATIASTTHYELWISDTGSGRSYRTEVVEWPTAVLHLTQDYYRFYADNDALDPTDVWPPGGSSLGENTAITSTDEPPSPGDVLRVRMSVSVGGANVSRETKAFALQYGTSTGACGAVGTWYPVGEVSSTTALWRGHNATPLDGAALSGNPPTGGDLNLSVADRAGTYEEANPSALNPYRVLMGEDVEYDWVLEDYSAPDQTRYCFRMVESDGTPLSDYLYYPTLTTAGFEPEQRDWRWYGDEDMETPVVALAGTNTAPTGVGPGELVKLRAVVHELGGKVGTGVKFKLQFSGTSDFSTPYDVVSADDCVKGSRWCFGDGAGTEGATITARVVYTADACSGGVGSGCGTHNEYPYAPEVVGEVGTTSIASAGSVINLVHTYSDPIYIVEAISGDASGGAGNRPAAAIITATTSSSLTVRVQEPDDEADTHGAETVAYLVMERGAYELPDGTRIDAGRKATTHYYGNAVGGASDDTCSFTQTFSSAPVVLTALQTNSNTGTPDFLTASQHTVTTDDFACAIEVPDGVSSAPGSAETIGWIAFDRGAFGNHGVRLVASTTPASITGWTDTPWYEYLFPLDTFLAGPGIVASKQTRSGGDGGWVRFDSEDADSAQFVVDEADGGNRTHTGEVVGFLAFSTGGTLYRAGQSSFTFGALAHTEFEFTLKQQDALPGTTYFFRLYDTGADIPVAASTTLAGYPSLVAQSGTLTLALSGIETGSSTEGVVTDITTTATAIPFGRLTFGVPKTAAQRVSVTTNAVEGYQVFVFERQPLLAGAASIGDISGSNDSPVAWASGCSGASCFGYHAGDNTLAGGSTRFLISDTFAPLTSTLSEIAYSAVPVSNEATDVVYRIYTSASQPAGLYEGRVGYVVVAVF